MSIKKIEADEYTCDGCGSIQLIDQDNTVLGYVGTVLWQHETGGNGGDWFACTKKCIAKAVTFVCERSDY